MKIHHTDLGPIEITIYFGAVPIFRLQLACKIKKTFYGNVMVCRGGARARFVHFQCPRFMTLANVTYLEVLLDLTIKFARAIETKKFETNPMGS